MMSFEYNGGEIEDTFAEGFAMWGTYPEPFDPDLEAEMTWKQIYAKVDEILVSPEARRHRFPGSPEVRVTETVEILPHGARRIRVHWPRARSYGT